MREIKFRCWYEGKMYPISILQNGYAADVLDTDWEKREAEVGMLELKTPVMQFTGLQDKNGKEIYEGDIVKANKYWSMAAVHYFAPNWGISNKKGVCTEFRNDEWESFEVIGNIYENPEPLTK